MKKHIKIILLCFIFVVLFELLVFGYESCINKIFKEKHLVGNDTFSIQFEELEIKEERRQLFFIFK